MNKRSDEVLKQFRFIHCKYYKLKHINSVVTGCFLNSYLEHHPFDGRKRYKVCKTLFSLFDSKNLQKKEQKVTVGHLSSAKLREGGGSSTVKRTREERSVSRLHQKFGIMTDEDIRRLKRVKITVGSASEAYIREWGNGTSNDGKEETRRERRTWLDRVRLYTRIQSTLQRSNNPQEADENR